MNKGDLKKLENLLDKISAGPWKVDPHESWDKDICINGRLIIVDNDDVGHNEAEANAKFICLARNVLPELISIVLDKC